MKKEYKGTNHKYILEVKEGFYDFPESLKNPPSHEPYKHIMKDLSPFMSSYSNWLVIKQCLENLKEHDKITNGRVNHYGQVLENIESYDKTGKTEWD